MNGVQETTRSRRTPIRCQADLRLRDPKVGAVSPVRRLGWAAFGALAQPPALKEWVQVQFYHWILDDQREIFRRQLESLRQYGDFISLDDTVELLRTGSRIGGRYFCVTFDDGFKNCLTNAAPVLHDLSVPAAFFIPTKYIGLHLDEDWEDIAPFYERSWSEFEGAFEFLDWDECRKLVSAGFTVGSHTHSHPRLTSLKVPEVETELRTSKREIEAQLGTACRHFCCPWGKVTRDFDPASHPAMAREAGYQSFLTTEQGPSQTGDSPYYIRRVGCEPDHNPAMLKYALFSKSNAPRKQRSVDTGEAFRSAPRAGAKSKRSTVSGTEPELVRLRKFPYPFQAAFTVASDIDSASVARFRAMHALIGGEDVLRPGDADWQTLGLSEGSARFDERLGGIRGLGLNLADSFFLIGDRTTFGMYRQAGENGGFLEDEQDGLNCKRFIQDRIKRGDIDSFHAFLHHTRDQVAPLLNDFYDWCEREAMPKPRVWINHSLGVTPSGLCPDRLQPNRAGRLARLSARNVVGPALGRKRLPMRTAFARYQGDTPSSPYYLNDLLAANGLRYVWLNMDDLRCNQVALPERSLHGRETILEPVTMDDGIRYYRFDRCYGKPSGRRGGEAYLKDSADGFDASRLIAEDNLAELCRSAGTCILYTHWAHFRSFPIAEETIGRFALLRRWADEKRIWVASTSQLLEWTRRRTFLAFTATRDGERLVIQLDGIEDPIFGQEKLSLKDYDGFCFEMTEPCAEVIVLAGGLRLNPNQVRRSAGLCWLDLAAS